LSEVPSVAVQCFAAEWVSQSLLPAGTFALTVLTRRPLTPQRERGVAVALWAADALAVYSTRGTLGESLYGLHRSQPGYLGLALSHLASYFHAHPRMFGDGVVAKFGGAAVEGARLLWQLWYMMDDSPYWSPFHWISGARLTPAASDPGARRLRLTLILLFVVFKLSQWVASRPQNSSLSLFTLFSSASTTTSTSTSTTLSSYGHTPEDDGGVVIPPPPARGPSAARAPATS
jgi:hypothetical protein